MNRRIQKIMNIVIAMSILHSATMPLYAQPTLRERAYQTGQSLWSGAQRAGSYVGVMPGALFGSITSSGEWAIQKIQQASTQFPVWGRRRIANGLQLFATPSEQEQAVIDRWVEGGALYQEQAQVWQRFYRRALSSRSAIGTMIGIIIAILGGIAAYQRLISDRQGQPQALPAPDRPAQEEISEEQVIVGRRRASGRPRPISPASKPSTFHAARSVKPAPRQVTEEQVTVGRSRASGRQRPISPVSKPTTFHATRPAQQAQGALPAPSESILGPEDLAAARLEGGEAPAYVAPPPPVSQSAIMNWKERISELKQKIRNPQRYFPVEPPGQLGIVHRRPGVDWRKLNSARVELERLQEEVRRAEEQSAQSQQAPAALSASTSGQPERPIHRPRGAPGRRLPSRRRRSESAAPAMQAQEQQTSTAESQLSRNWIVVPTEWERIKQNIQNYMAEVREQIKHGNVVPYDETELKGLVQQIDVAQLSDEAKQAMQADLDTLLGKGVEPGEVVQLMTYIGRQAQELETYESVKDLLIKSNLEDKGIPEEDLKKLGPEYKKIYEFLGLTPEKGREMSGKDIMKKVETIPQPLKRQLEYIFRDEKNKELYEAYVQGPEAVESIPAPNVPLDTVENQLDEVQNPDTGIKSLLMELKAKLQRP